MTNVFKRNKHIYTEQEVYLKLSTLCAMGELCVEDAKRKMKRWEIAEDVIEQIVARLIKERFIDEERYAKAFVRDKFRYNHWGKVRIEKELKMRHIAQKHITLGLEELKEEDNLCTLREIIQKKRSLVKGKNEYEIRGKLIRFALGRGFVMDDILKVVGSLDEYME